VNRALQQLTSAGGGVRLGMGLQESSSTSANNESAGKSG